MVYVHQCRVAPFPAGTQVQGLDRDVCEGEPLAIVGEPTALFRCMLPGLLAFHAITGLKLINGVGPHIEVSAIATAVNGVDLPDENISAFERV